VSSVTDQILSAWDDDEEESAPEPEASDEAVVEEPEPTELPDEEEEEETEEPAEEEEEETETEEEGEEGEEGEQPEEPEDEVLAQFTDAEVRAYLSRYQNDPERALKAAVNLTRVLNRQGKEKNEALRRVAELEQELAQQQAFQAGPGLLSQEQVQWVGEAIESGNPNLYVQQAVRAGEYELARAVCAEWAREQPYEAMRVSQAVDGAEYNAHAAQVAQVEDEPIDHGLLLDTLVDSFPEMPVYEQQMIEHMNKLGPGHPLVQDAQSNDVRVAAKALVNLYELARASTASVRSTREQLREKTKTDAAEVRRRAVVSSSQATPAPSQTPRGRTIMPGLTLEQLEAEWENE